MLGKCPLWKNNLKTKNPSRRWHRRAWIIDTTKTKLVIEKVDTRSECTQPLMDNERARAIQTEEERFDLESD